ncbi:metallopeptidase TldD-related protein, partial [Mycobacterium tuberculosis]
PTDLVIDPTNLWLTIHESIGHATEYDRAIGYEAAYAGTSFATPDKLGTLRYGSPVMNVTADRTAEFGLATVGYDDEGVAAQSWDLVRDG